ncbi:hypothetical protein [Brevundimonas subvibrioides]|uniref:hypothetical protein n=1 Tax=Brevundimonas subvibrioides TaxID=74313 RepID=UPI0022B33EE0|nr:hypothetical protein [Brevundimonas subvibrioides]
MKVVGRVFGFLFQALMFLVSLGILAGFGLVLLGGLDDPFLEMRRGYWTLVTAAGVILALVVNPVIWRLLKGRVPTLLFLALGLGLPVGLFTLAAWTPYGLYLRSGLDGNGEETDLAVDAEAGSSQVPAISSTLRLAAERGDPEAQLELAQQLVKTEGASTDEGLASLRDAASAGSADAQALLAVLQMGQSFEGRVVLQRNDPEACNTMLALQSPPFTGQEIDAGWERILEDASRYRGWRRADEPGEPLRCERASLNPKTDTLIFVEENTSSIPARFNAFTNLKAEMSCTVTADLRLDNCTVLTAWPAGQGVDRWGLDGASRVRLAPKDIYGYPVAGREIIFTITPEDETS